MEQDIVKKTVFHQFVSKFNAIDTKILSLSALLVNNKKIMRKRLRVLIKRYLILLGWSTRKVDDTFYLTETLEKLNIDENR